MPLSSKEFRHYRSDHWAQAACASRESHYEQILWVLISSQIHSSTISHFIPSVLLAWAHPTSSNVFKLWWSIDRILQQCLCWNGVSLSIKQPFHLSHWKRRQRNGFSLSSASIYQLIFTLPSSPTGDPQQVCSILPFWQFWLGMDDCPLHAKDRCELLKSKLELQSSLICPVLYWAAKEMDPSV